MIHGIDTASAILHAGRALSRVVHKPFDAKSELSAALAPAWRVEQATDYIGEISFVALPAWDDPEMPTFIAYERDGRAHIASVRQDEWQNARSFTTLRLAVNAIIARAGTCQITHA